MTEKNKKNKAIVQDREYSNDFDSNLNKVYAFQKEFNLNKIESNFIEKKLGQKGVLLYTGLEDYFDTTLKLNAEFSYMAVMYLLNDSGLDVKNLNPNKRLDLYNSYMTEIINNQHKRMTLFNILSEKTSEDLSKITVSFD